MSWTDDRNLARVAEFHWVFGLPVAQWPEKEIAEKTLNLRIELLREELEEYVEAATGRRVKVDIHYLEGAPKNPTGLTALFDAHCDLQYVLDGSFLSYGLHKIKEAGMSETHSSNMTKLDRRGKPIIRDDGKILKSDRFRLPRLGDVIENYQMFGE